MPQSMSFVRIGPAPGNETGLAPWPWNPNDVLLAEGMMPVGAKSYEGRGLTRHALDHRLRTERSTLGGRANLVSVPSARAFHLPATSRQTAPEAFIVGR